MRNSNSTAMGRSSASTSQRQPQLMTHSTIAEGYDFNRARSSESTENAMAGKDTTTSVPSQVTSSSSSSSVCSFEDRGVPVSPKILPPTPPRDRGSPYRPQAATARHQAPPREGLLQPISLFSERVSSPPQQPFLRPSSSWRHKEEEHHGSSVFRSPGSAVMSRDHESFYTIQRSYAFDEDDGSNLDFE